MAIDIDKFMQPISEEAPCGEDISYDLGFMEMERLAAGTAAKEMGDQVVEGEEPDWKEVRKLALGLMEKSKNLRVMLYLTLASMQLDGLSGLRDGLVLMKQVLEQDWDAMYPQLDPDDDNDPMERINIIASFSPEAGAFDDPIKFIDRLRKAPLVTSKQVGRYCLADIMVVCGELPAPWEGEAPSDQLLRAAFQDSELEDLEATHEAITQANEAFVEMDQWLTEKVGAGQAPNLNNFIDELKNLSKRFAEYASSRLDVGTASEEDGDGGDGSGGGGGGTGQSLTGDINTRSDVVRAIDKVCEYYRRVEPSSPVPLILKRAQRLVDSDFRAIIQDLNPSALGQINIIVGEDGEISSGSSTGSSTGSSETAAASSDDGW
jgi:type VI secretion system protein ImpA